VVLAYDKRGSGQTPEDPVPGDRTWLEDASSALSFLQARPDVDARRVAITGHSQGAGIALRIAVAEPSEVAGVVMLCGAGRSGRELIREQILGNVLDPVGVMGKAAEPSLRFLDASMGALYEGEALPEPSEHVHPKVAAIVRRVVSNPSIKGCGVCGTTWEEDPRDYARRLHAPLLVVGGGRDVQIRRADFDALVSSASDSTAVFIDDLDHVLKVETRSMEELEANPDPARYAEPREIHPRVLEEIVTFLRRVL
jgi:pimeloyl-ACP methyl ester carboxylesterase